MYSKKSTRLSEASYSNFEFISIMIKIYTTQWCGYCKMAKEFFKEKGVAYEEYDVGNDQKKAEEMMQKSNQMGVPVIDVNGTIIVGFNKKKLEELIG